jgi:hypothetical protein
LSLRWNQYKKARSKTTTYKTENKQGNGTYVQLSREGDFAEEILCADRLTMTEENDPNDHAAENVSDMSSDTLPAATPVKKERDDPTTPIIRSTYKSDVENNDNLPVDDSTTSPVLYTGDATCGVVHAIDSTDKKLTVHCWLEMIHLWPLVVESLRKRGYDTFHFTPYSSRENWMKMYPELKTVGIRKEKASPPSSKSVAKSSWGGSCFSIYVEMLLLGGFMYFAAMLGYSIGPIIMDTANISFQKKTRTSPSFAYKGGLSGEGQQQCLATDNNNNELGLREKIQILFGFGGNKIPIEEHAEALISWLNKEGGYVHPNLQMRHVDPSDPTSYLGLFVDDFIPEGEVILRVPRNMVLDSTEKNPDVEAMNCKTVRNLINQIKLKDESKYAPYVNFLTDTQLPSIPVAWSQAGKDLLNRVIGNGNNLMEEQLPPYSPPEWLKYWHEECNGSDDPLEEYAALFLIHRNWDDLMIPIFDTMNHGNGHWVNTNSSDVHDTRIDVEVKASKDIKANEQLYMSYNRCETCGNRIYEYGTDQILWDYGFVEQMPQSFYFPAMEFGYRLDETGSGEAYVTDWVYEEPSSDHVETMKQMLMQISWKKATELSKQCEVNDHEWKTINNYVNALENGLKAAVKAIEKGGIEVVGEELVGTEDDSDDDSEDDSDDDE